MNKPDTIAPRRGFTKASTKVVLPEVEERRAEFSRMKVTYNGRRTRIHFLCGLCERPDAEYGATHGALRDLSFTLEAGRKTTRGHRSASMVSSETDSK